MLSRIAKRRMAVSQQTRKALGYNTKDKRLVLTAEDVAEALREVRSVLIPSKAGPCGAAAAKMPCFVSSHSCWSLQLRDSGCFAEPICMLCAAVRSECQICAVLREPPAMKLWLQLVQSAHVARGRQLVTHWIMLYAFRLPSGLTFCM